MSERVKNYEVEEHELAEIYACDHSDPMTHDEVSALGDKIARDALEWLGDSWRTTPISSSINAYVGHIRPKLESGRVSVLQAVLINRLSDLPGVAERVSADVGIRGGLLADQFWGALLLDSTEVLPAVVSYQLWNALPELPDYCKSYHLRVFFRDVDDYELGSLRERPEVVSWVHNMFEDSVELLPNLDVSDLKNRPDDGLGMSKSAIIYGLSEEGDDKMSTFRKIQDWVDLRLNIGAEDMN